jgi:hypothetical protein
MLTHFYKIHDYQILNRGPDLPICAQFTFRGYQISFTVSGLSQHQSHNDVVIFDYDFDKQDFTKIIKKGLSTVEEAIDYISNL